MFTRRDLLRVGSLGSLGLALPQLLQADEARKSRRAKSCILLFLEGGPATQDMWDLKPTAPVEYRGETRPISSSLTGLPVCENLPLLSREMHRVTLLQAVHHSIVDHNAGAYYALTGRSPVAGGRLIVRDEPDNFPPYGAVLARHFPHGKLPEFVQLPDVMSNLGYDLPGQRAGFLGAAYDPFVAGDPSSPKYQLPGLTPLKEGSAARIESRRQLLGPLSGNVDAGTPDASALDIHYDKAFSLLQSSETRQAFDLSQEPTALRERYGLPDRVDRQVEARKFGGLPHLGQCLLTARRLVEAGVRLVTVCSGRRIDQAWDTHRQHFDLMKQSLLPYLDRALSALLGDLAERGLLDETLVVVMGEFGRTPQLGQITSNAGATPAGRDHWPHCYSVMLAGGGVKAGLIHGASDRYAAYPHEKPVTPEEIAATIYMAMGLDPESRITDALNRPHSLALGEPIAEIFR